MDFEACTVDGAWIIAPRDRPDERGTFSRLFCAATLQSRGLEAYFPQVNVARSIRAGTLRGMHLQRPPHAEVKIVRCNRGSAFDVVLDLRPDSPTFRRWFGLELSGENGRMLYVTAGCAHGYQTLVDGAEVMYFTSTPYAPSAATGVRHDDPAFGIRWPMPPTSISA